MFFFYLNANAHILEKCHHKAIKQTVTNKLRYYDANEIKFDSAKLVPAMAVNMLNKFTMT